MLLTRAAKKFDTNTYDGYDGTKWVPEVIKGSLESFGRVINEREHSSLRRNLTSSEQLPREYPLLRSANGEVYLLVSSSVDTTRDIYSTYIYLLQKATHTANIISFTKTDSASGMGGDIYETTTYSVPCYIQRTSSNNADAGLDFVVYTRFRALLPSYVTPTEGGELEIEDKRYTIKEVDTELNMKRAYLLEK